MKKIIYKVYNPEREKTYAGTFEADAPNIVRNRVVQRINEEAGAGSFGVVWDPDNKWKFDWSEIEY